jgi:uncharacterized SAM-dependent methyltransferase
MERKSFLIEQLKSCRKTKNRDSGLNYWFDFPYHLYYEEEQALKYLEMIEKDNFSISLHKPIEELVRNYANSLIGINTKKVELYDLGPGLPTKTIPLIKNLQKRNIPFSYIPIDISKSFLKLAQDEVSKFGVNSQGINCLFEELPNKIDKKIDTQLTRIFLIGLTFNNYRPNQILSLLSKLCEKNDIAIIITEYYEKDKEKSILIPYQDEYAENFNFLVLKLMGFEKKDFKYFARFRNQRIEMGFKPIKKITVGDLNLKNNDKIITAISYRYTNSSLTRYIQNYYKNFEYYKENDLVMFKLKE